MKQVVQSFFKIFFKKGHQKMWPIFDICEFFLAIGSVDCVGCSSAEDEQNDSSPPPSQSFAKDRQRKPSKTMKLLNHDNINALLRLSIMIFTKDIYSNQTLALAAQLIAEVCREPEGRKMALKYKADISLVQSLGQVLAKPRSTETCVQVCRIIGNLW